MRYNEEFSSEELRHEIINETMRHSGAGMMFDEDASCNDGVEEFEKSIKLLCEHDSKKIKQNLYLYNRLVIDERLSDFWKHSIELLMLDIPFQNYIVGEITFDELISLECEVNVDDTDLDVGDVHLPTLNFKNIHQSSPVRKLMQKLLDLLAL
jgi:hypothetical protein